MIDLHTHSNASDGSLSPEELIRSAAKRGLSAIALTDHDTIGGLEAAKGESARAGIRFIPGIELDIAWKGGRPGLFHRPCKGEFHLLGLGIDRPSGAFIRAVAALSQRREARNRDILEQMRSLDIHAEYEEVRALSGGGSVGRPHFAELLVQRGLVKNREQAFSRYLGQGRPLYVPKAGLEFSLALSLIKESGGIPVLAHPMSLFTAWGRLPGVIQNLANQGLEGIEAWHPAATVRTCKRLEALGKSLGLAVTGGSDFHGETRPDRKLGLSAGGRKIGEEFLEAIPALARFSGGI
jgi:predicted metal-dependent phosphoesterase TrpH